MRCSRYVVAEHKLQLLPDEVGAGSILRLHVEPIVDKQACGNKKISFQGHLFVAVEYVPAALGAQPVYYKTFQVPYADFIRCRRIKAKSAVRVLAKIEFKQYELIDERNISLVVAANFSAVRAKADRLAASAVYRRQTATAQQQSYVEVILPEVLPSVAAAEKPAAQIMIIDAQPVGLIAYIKALGGKLWKSLVGLFE